MTVNEVVDKSLRYFNGKSIDLNKLQTFFKSNNLTVNETLACQILDFYNRKLIELHRKKGAEVFEEDYTSYMNRRKDLDVFLSALAGNLSTTEFHTLKKKINELVDAAILWSKK
jgi:hypothetical protein